MTHDGDGLNIPPVHSRLADVDGKLRLLSGRHKPLTALDAERPEAICASEITLKTGERGLVMHCREGATGLIVAAVNPSARLLLHDPDVRQARLASLNAALNAALVPNVEIASTELVNQLVEERNLDAVVFVPDRSMALDLIANQIAFARAALRSGGRFFLVTHKRLGGGRHEALIHAEFGGAGPVVRRGRGGYLLIETERGSDEADRPALTLRRPISFEVRGIHFDLETESSLFSKDDLDIGTRLLLERVEVSSFHRVLDIGCGWGAIGLVTATRNATARVIMVDVDRRATTVAAANVRRLGLEERVDVVTTDDVDDLPGTFDLVLSNPPFRADAETLRALFAKTRRKMVAGGELHLVVERTYLRRFAAIVGNVFGSVITDPDATGRFWILSARR